MHRTLGRTGLVQQPLSIPAVAQRQVIRRRTAAAASASAPKRKVSEKDKKAIDQWQSTLLTHHRRGESQQGFKHTKTRKAEKDREYDALFVASGKHKPVPSPEKLKFFAEEPVNDGPVHTSLDEVNKALPGMFVETRRNTVVIHGVILAESTKNSRYTNLVLSDSGEVLECLREDIMFSVPTFISSDLISRCGISDVAESTTQNAARVEVLQRLRHLNNAVERVFNNMHQHMPALYDRVRAQGDHDWGRTSVAQAVELVPTNTDSYLLKSLAMHKHMMARSAEYLAPSVGYRATQSFAVRPKADIDRLRAVEQMTRERSPALESFAVKAREIIRRTRERHIQSWSEPPSMSSPSASASGDEQVQFDNTDRMILNFLLSSLYTKRSIQHDPFLVPVSTIIHTIGFHQNEGFDPELLQRILIDLTVLAPWQDLSERESGLSIEPEPTRHTTWANDVVERGLARLKTAPATSVAGSEQPLGPEDFYAKDAVDHIRHDFGDMAVYVIDDFDAQELDDGVSVTTVPNEPNTHWVHAHIADPTSVLPPGHVLAQHARSQQSTLYMLHRTWPMLPWSLVKGRLSLGSLAASGREQRAMTFSFKVDPSGNIVDYQVRASIIRNVRVVQYDEVDKVLDMYDPQRLNCPFGMSTESKAEPQRVGAHIPPSHVPELRMLKEVTDRLRRRRFELPVFNYAIAKPQLSLSPKSLPPSAPPSAWPVQFRGFPNINYLVRDSDKDGTGSRGIVGEIMVGAGRAASRFATAHGLPFMRRTAGQFLTFSDEDFLEILRTKNERNMADWTLLTKKGVISPTTGFVLEPAQHWPMGVPDGEGYSWVTSPLRRYADLVAHWQIKHALLKAHDSSVAHALPFDPQALEGYALEATAQMAHTSRLEIFHQRTWAIRYISRILESPTGSPGGREVLEDLKVYPINTPAFAVWRGGWKCSAFSPQLGLPCAIVGLSPAEKELIRIGEPVQCRVKNVKHGFRGEVQVELLKKT